MSDSFFDFDQSSTTNHDASFAEEEDDTDYDALNNETFGEDIPSTDWEEDHAKLAASEQLRKKSFDEENSELGKRIASFILDDEVEGDETVPMKPCKTSSADNSSTWWTNGKETSQIGGRMENNMTSPVVEPWWDLSVPKHNQMLSNDKNLALTPSKPLKFFTVEEIEKNMKKEAESKAVRRPHLPPTNRNDTQRLNIDFEPNNRTPINVMRNQLPNDRYPRNRHGNDPNIMHQRGGRFRHPNDMSGGFNRGLPPMPLQYPAYADVRRPLLRHPAPPNMIRQIGPHHQGPPRHPGNQYPRHAPDPHYVSSHRPMMETDQSHQPMLPNQAGGYSQQSSSGPPPPVDEYAGLMSDHEKQWLANIQMMLLNSNQPYQDDYYYTMFLQRQQGNAGRKYGNPNHKNNREMTASKPTATYIPLQFENSLGKLQIGSVTAPRKIIDMDLVENVENNAKHIEKKSKIILMEIEEVWNIVLKMEDVYNPAGLPNIDVDLAALQDKVMATLTADGKLVAFMGIKKGKRAVLKLLPYLFNSGPLIQKLLEDLVPITKKDQEQLLLSFLPSIRMYLATVPLKTLVELIKSYDTVFLLSSKFTVSVMANMLERAGLLVCSNDEDEAVVKGWCDFLVRLVESTNHWTETERPVVAVDRPTLSLQLRLITDKVSKERIEALIQALSKSNATTTATATGQQLSPH